MPPPLFPYTLPVTITAKYPTTCPVCHAPIRPGDKIEWTKGQKSHHTVCPSPEPAAPETSTAQQASRARQHLLDLLGTAFKLFGEHPAGTHAPDGEHVLLQTNQTLLATERTSAIIGTEWIWYMESAHGVPKLQNIHAADLPLSGWRLSFTSDLAEQLRSLSLATPSERHPPSLSTVIPSHFLRLRSRSFPHHLRSTNMQLTIGVPFLTLALGDTRTLRRSTNRP